MRSGVALVFLAAACIEVRAAHAAIEDTAPPDRDSSGFKVEYRAGGGERTLAVTSPEGRVAACRAAGGVSWLLDAQNLEWASAFPPILDDAMSLRWPGVKMVILEESGGEAGRVAIFLERGGERVQITADDPDGDHRAHVLISGADESTLRDFIARSGGLSHDVRARLLAELGLANS
jgi:hypothetical protein